MATPTNVTSKSDKAREMIAAMQTSAATAPQESPTAETTDSAAPAPVETAPVETAPDTPTVETTDAAKDETPNSTPNTSWKRRFELLRNARNERADMLSQENQELRQRLEQEAQRTAAQTPPQAPLRFELDDETRGDMNDTEAKVIDRLGQHVDSRFDQLEQKQLQEESRLRELFFDDLSVKAPAWQRLNGDPAFLAWLDSVDPEVGVPRRPSFNRLAADRNVNAVAGIINSYVAVENASAQASAPVADTNVSPEPSTTRSAPQSEADVMIEVYHPDEVKEFYAEKNYLLRMGKLKNPTIKAEVDAREQKIQQAMRENRVYA